VTENRRLWRSMIADVVVEDDDKCSYLLTYCIAFGLNRKSHNVPARSSLRMSRGAQSVPDEEKVSGVSRGGDEDAMRRRNVTLKAITSEAVPASVPASQPAKHALQQTRLPADISRRHNGICKFPPLEWTFPIRY